MKTAIALLVLTVGCGGDDSSGGDPGSSSAGPGTRDGSGWETTFGTKASPGTGTDGKKRIYPLMMEFSNATLQLVYGENTMSQQGEIGGRFEYRFTDGGPAVEAAAGIPFPINQASDTHQYFWHEHEPVAYRVYKMFGSNQLYFQFVKRGLTLRLVTALLPPKGQGFGAIGPKGELYAYNVIPFLSDETTNNWKSMSCYPVNGIPPVNQIGSVIQAIDATDPTRFLQLSIRGSAIQIWRRDPDLPLEPVDMRPQCTPIAQVEAPEVLSRAFYRVIGGVGKVIAYGETKVLVYTYVNHTLTLEAQTDISTEFPPFGLGVPQDRVDIATTDTDLWIAYLDASHEKRVTVKVQQGATFEVVGEPGFTTSMSSTVPRVAAKFDGTVYVSFSKLPEDDVDGLGSLWIARPR